MRKFSIEEVKQIVESYDGVKLLSTKYKDNNTPLDLLCKCGNPFKRSLVKIQRNKNFLVCEKCRDKISSEKYRKDFSDVLFEIENGGCKYISGEYINRNSLLYLRCKCGKPFYKSMSKFNSGQNRCPDCGKELLKKAKTKYTVDDVQDEISKSNYTILDKNSYIDAAHPIKCICKRGHKFNLIFSQYLDGCSGCAECSYINKSGENNYNWKGGESEVLDKLRKSIKSWKLDIGAYYGFKCAITGDKKYVVHHIISFADMMYQASINANVPILRKISDYNDLNDFEKLKSELLRLHTNRLGITLSKEIHDEFHKLYGKGNNTREQLNEFLINNYNIDLDTVQKDKKSILYTPDKKAV